MAKKKGDWYRIPIGLIGSIVVGPVYYLSGIIEFVGRKVKKHD